MSCGKCRIVQSIYSLAETTIPIFLVKIEGVFIIENIPCKTLSPLVQIQYRSLHPNYYKHNSIEVSYRQMPRWLPEISSIPTKGEVAIHVSLKLCRRQGSVAPYKLPCSEIYLSDDKMHTSILVDIY